MKRIIFTVLFFILLYNPSEGAKFYVSNPAEFQNALTAAQSNGQDDVIYVISGIYNITSTLTYITSSGDGGHTLTIQGEGADSTILDGADSVAIMDILTANYGGNDIGGDVFIVDITFKNGKGGPNGGGLNVGTQFANIYIKNCKFLNNNTNGSGGGATLRATGTIYGCITLRGNLFAYNSATSFGGGAYIDSHIVTLTGNIFISNSSGTQGGGAFVSHDYASSNITNNIFYNNSSGYGGGISIFYFSEGGLIHLTNNTFVSNQATYGGGAEIFIDSFDPTIPNSYLYVYNNIFWQNNASEGGNDGDDLFVNSYKNGEGSWIFLYNNNFSGNANFDTGKSEDLYIKNTSFYQKGSNIQQDPLFVNPSSFDFHLQSSSPCINAGENNTSLPNSDFEGDPRIINGTVDIGADEYEALARLYVAVKGATNNNIYLRYKENGIWSIWQRLSGATSRAPSLSSFKGKLYMAVKGATNNNLYLNSMDSNGNWGSWTQIQGQTTLSPALVTFKNLLYLFVKGATNNQIYYKHMDSNGQWQTTWSVVPGGATGDSPSAIVYDDELWLFVKGATNNNIYFNIMDRWGQWSGWGKFESGATGTSPAGVIYNNYGYMFVKGATNNNIYYIREGWDSWSNLSGSTTKTPSLVSNPKDGLLYLSVKGATNDNIYYRTMDASGVWSPSWLTMDGATSESPVLTIY